MATDLSLTVDRESALPLSEQVRGSLRRLIEDGSLGEDSPLPSSRQLAADLAVSRSVVVEAYEQLVAEGYLATRRGSGTRVANGIGRPSGAASALTRALPERTESAWDLRTGTSDLDAFPRREWVRSVTAALAQAGRAELGYAPLSGAPHLRHVLAGHLGRTRGVRISPQNLMITAGFAQGLALLCAMLRENGHRDLGVEDPSHPGEREFIASAGLRPVGIPVDAEGLRVDLLERSPARAVLTTPGNQFPTGVRLSPARRAQLIEWARKVDGYILEDDFDCAYLDRADRVPSLQNLAPDRVVYAGSVSKVLAPALRLGWIAGPPEVMSGVEAVRAGWDIGCSGLEQLAFAHFVATGAYDRHQRALRTESHKRRALIRTMVAEHFPGAHMLGGDSGIQAFVTLPSHMDEQVLVREARNRSILIRGGAFYTLDDRTRPPALVLGYATIDGKGLQTALTALGDIYRSCAVR
ncbi:transcriptional regulator, GntR family with aminotransferase domain [Catenulispora acidiphila DSM 44928]|uniref:Transcriptional regulator, GntR family with aminotransferase domain n=1 Tax=Catenulispora acidiphila (strain DSM 44928 / JCM 14897 / NBRC 102108 / NRRL B-24433 / ID139908) TaxID=479433 RepID=C7QBU9_CATAD|nr:PLP-dependent aminotransferase family protein [Catenulispora acidiphila]ACU72568.1 transcriptional regulator, GntR family with aminotransferase domain [Catenulispora acidiphila DSM 44928]